MTTTEQIEAIRHAAQMLMGATGKQETAALAAAVNALANVAAEQERRLRVLEPCEVDTFGHHRWSDGADTYCLRCAVKVKP